MPRTVLVAIDYSDGAARAWNTALALVAGNAGALVALHVLPGQPPQADPSNVWDETRALRGRAEEELRSWLAAHGGAPEHLRVAVEWGDVAMLIRQTASRERAELIVLGAHGTTPVPGQILGAVARQVVEQPPCPVCVIHVPGAAVPTVLPASANVGSVVRRAPITIRQDQTLAEAAELMEREAVHQLPVVEDGRLIAIVTQRDMQGHIGYFERTKVDAVMTRAPVTVQPGDRPEDAARILLDRAFNALPVVDGERLVGMVSRTDLLRLLVQLLDERGRTSPA
jgi:CBS domain-containing protein/nucleotide-binding universal stress UspA family protein